MVQEFFLYFEEHFITRFPARKRALRHPRFVEKTGTPNYSNTPGALSVYNRHSLVSHTSASQRRWVGREESGKGEEEESEECDWDKNGRYQNQKRELRRIRVRQRERNSRIE